MASTPEVEPPTAASGCVAGLNWRWLGRVPFREALTLQERWIAEHERRGDCLLLLEHPSTYTTGRGGAEANLPADPAITVERIGRGGDVTWHGPGQLVGYPILDLRSRGRDVHRYLRALEDGIIAFLGEQGVRGTRLDGRTGVWVPQPEGPARKIASIGIGVRRSISWHGFALNLAPDLAAFERIVPCGLDGVEMTSLLRENALRVSTEEAAPRMAATLAPILQMI